MKIITEDSNTITYEPEKKITNGHIIISPKQKYVILEETPDTIVGEIFNKANEQTLTIFKEQKATGVNMLIQNGNPAGQKKAQLEVHIIPRTEGDNIPLTWNPRQTTEEHLAEAQKRITTALKEISEETKQEEKSKKREEINERQEENKKQETKKTEETKTSKEETDYRIKQMKKTA